MARTARSGREPAPGMQICSGPCGQEKPYANPGPHGAFPKGSSRHGTGYWCHQCHTDYDARRYIRNQDAIKSAASDYARRNPGRKAASSAKRRQAVKRSATRLSPDQEAQLLAYYGECVGCGATTGLSLDHVIPLAAGGSDGPENRQPLDERCNKRKKDSALDLRPAWYRQRVAQGRDPGPPPFPWPGYDGPML